MFLEAVRASKRIRSLWCFPLQSLEINRLVICMYQRKRIFLSLYSDTVSNYPFFVVKNITLSIKHDFSYSKQSAFCQSVLDASSLTMEVNGENGRESLPPHLFHISIITFNIAIIIISIVIASHSCLMDILQMIVQILYCLHHYCYSINPPGLS